MLDLRGNFPPIPTPFNKDQFLDLKRLTDNLNAWNEQPLAGYVVGGSNGEAVSLRLDERVALLAAAREIVPRDRLLVAGAGAQSTAETIDLIAAMAETGADAVILVTPSYYGPQLGAEAFIRHYASAADTSPIPVILYNVPVYTKLDLPLESVLELSKHSNIIGIKESHGDLRKIASMVSETQADFQVLAGSAGFFLPALSVGAVGCVPALGCIAPGELDRLLREFQSGDLQTAQETQARLIAPNRAVTSEFGVPGLKAALDLVGLYGGPPRDPLQPLGDEDRERVQAVLADANLL